MSATLTAITAILTSLSTVVPGLEIMSKPHIDGLVEWGNADTRIEAIFAKLATEIPPIVDRKRAGQPTTADEVQSLMAGQICLMLGRTAAEGQLVTFAPPAKSAVKASKGPKLYPWFDAVGRAVSKRFVDVFMAEVPELIGSAISGSLKSEGVPHVISELYTAYAEAATGEAKEAARSKLLHAYVTSTDRAGFLPILPTSPKWRAVNPVTGEVYIAPKDGESESPLAGLAMGWRCDILQRRDRKSKDGKAAAAAADPTVAAAAAALPDGEATA